MSKLDNIFAEYDGYTIEKYLKDEGHNHSKNRQFVEGKQQIKDLILELIGEDEDNFAPGDSEWQDASNDLRAGLRKKVEEL